MGKLTPLECEASAYAKVRAALGGTFQTLRDTVIRTGADVLLRRGGNRLRVELKTAATQLATGGWQWSTHKPSLLAQCLESEATVLVLAWRLGNGQWRFFVIPLPLLTQAQTRLLRKRKLTFQAEDLARPSPVGFGTLESERRGFGESVLKDAAAVRLDLVRCFEKLKEADN